MCLCGDPADPAHQHFKAEDYPEELGAIRYREYEESNGSMGCPREDPGRIENTKN